MVAQHILRGRQWLMGLLALSLMAWPMRVHAQIAPPLTILYNFTGGADGSFPDPIPLVLGKDGLLYGITNTGGAYGWGTAFSCTLSGQLTTLYSFDENSIDGGGNPNAVTQAKDGNLYGTTYGGGPLGSGTVFEITPSGTVRHLPQCLPLCRPGTGQRWQLLRDDLFRWLRGFRRRVQDVAHRPCD